MGHALCSLEYSPEYPISAIYKNTVPTPSSPWVMPGRYVAKLTVDGAIFTQTFNVAMDPRVKTSINDLQMQHDISLQCYQNQKRNCSDQQ